MNLDIQVRTYRVSRVGNYRENWHENTSPAIVDNFPWAGSGTNEYRPITAAKMAVCDDSLLVFMDSSETGIRAEERGCSGKVHTDSCMEFFLMPDPENSNQYLNWEFNPAGAMCLGIGTCRYDRHAIQDDNYLDLFQVKPLIHANGWSIEYRISFVFLRSCFASLDLKPGYAMRGNFYKCGDKTIHPHFACWSPIDLPKPDFHCPGFFGVLSLE